MATYSTHASALQSQIEQMPDTTQKSTFGMGMAPSALIPENAAKAASLALLKAVRPLCRSHQWLGYSDHTMVELGTLLFIPVWTLPWWFAWQPFLKDSIGEQSPLLTTFTGASIDL
jgi:hypothetical protein